MKKLSYHLWRIAYLNNKLEEGTLIQFAKNDTPETAIRALEGLAKNWNMRFVRDTSLFGGHYVRPDGICYFIK